MNPEKLNASLFPQSIKQPSFTIDMRNVGSQEWNTFLNIFN